MECANATKLHRKFGGTWGTRTGSAGLEWGRAPAPGILTINGKDELIESCQRTLEHLETIAAIQQGIASAERREPKPDAHVSAEMLTKYGLLR